MTSGGGHLLASRTLGYAVAYVGLVLTIQFLKRRLVQAESQQRQMANQDPLTGLANRRAFDSALSRRARRRQRRRRASRCCWPTSTPSSRSTTASGTRPATACCARSRRTRRPRSGQGDCLARIGGDELALVAQGAGAQTARRLADALRDAAARVDTGAGPVSLTVSWAVYPEDGTDRFTLMRSLDRGLHAGKGLRRAAAQE